MFSALIQKCGPYGAYRLGKNLTAGFSRVLMYHRFSKEPTPGRVSSHILDSQLDYLKKNYNVVSLTDMTSAMFDKASDIATRKAPKHTVVITVDDGYRDFYDVAFPLLKKHGLPATLFATTGFVSGDLWLWPDKVLWLLNNTSHIKENIQLASLTVTAGEMTLRRRAEEWQRIISFLLSVPDADKHTYLSQLESALSLSLPDVAPEEFEACSWEKLLEMQEAGIEIGAHTVSHPSLGRVDVEQAHDEIWGSLTGLNQHLGAQERSFCYPNGTPQDYTPEIQRMVKDAGFINAVVAHHDHVGVKERYAIRRHTSSEDMFQFYKAVSGIELLGNKVRHFIK